jgi:hypothetical protein
MNSNRNIPEPILNFGRPLLISANIVLVFRKFVIYQNLYRMFQTQLEGSSNVPGRTLAAPVVGVVKWEQNTYRRQGPGMLVRVPQRVAPDWNTMDLHRDR